MVLKIVASHGTHYKDGVFDVALWSQPSLAHYVGEPPFGAYTTEGDEKNADEVSAGEVVREHDTVIPYFWPDEPEDERPEAIPVRGISYHSTRTSGEQKELFVSVDCSVYLMTDEGKTIERLI